MNIPLAGALVGGVLTLLSPCSVMLLPAFFAYAFTSSGRLLARTGVFYIGLLTTLIPLGVLAGTLGAVVNTHRGLLTTSAASVVIMLGAVQLLGIRLPTFGYTHPGTDNTSTTAVFLLGTVYGLAGVCAGPALGSVLALAAFGGNPLRGAIVITVFAFGMTLPLLLLSITWSRLPWMRALVRPRQLKIGRWSNTWTQIVSGGLGIAIGVFLIATRGTTSLGGILDVSQQFDLENETLARTGSIPDFVVIAAAVFLLGTGWQVRRRHRRSVVASARADSRRESSVMDTEAADHRPSSQAAE